MLSAENVAVLDALRWLQEDRTRRVEVLAAAIKLELPDPFMVAADLASDVVTGAELVKLSELTDGAFDGDVDELLTSLPFVGARVWVEEPDNVDAWLVVGRGIAHISTAKDLDWPDRYYFAREEAPALLAEFLDAARGPSYANQMLESAHRVKLVPNAFGYGEGITPAAFVTLAEAGITNDVQLETYLGVGLTLPEAVTLAEARVSFAAVNWAAAQGIPRADWDKLLIGIPKSWFPEVGSERGGLFQYEYTIDDMRFLVDNGWEDFGTYRAHSGFKYGGRRAYTGPIRPQVARELATIAPADEIENWLQALASGKGGSSIDDQTLPPLRRVYKLTDDLIADVRALKDAGLRPSHMNTYRNAGCRSVANVLSAVEAGITPARAKALTEQFGTRRWDYRPLRLKGITDLLRLHRDNPVEEPAAS